MVLFRNWCMKFDSLGQKWHQGRWISLYKSHSLCFVAQLFIELSKKESTKQSDFVPGGSGHASSISRLEWLTLRLWYEIIKYLHVHIYLLIYINPSSHDSFTHLVFNWSRNGVFSLTSAVIKRLRETVFVVSRPPLKPEV